MKKQDIIKEVARQTGQSKATVTKTLDCAFDAIMAGVSKNEEVQIVGFGTFKSDARAARVARNPRNGKKVAVPAKVVPKFTAGSRFKSTVDQKR